MIYYAIAITFSWIMSCTVPAGYIHIDNTIRLGNGLWFLAQFWGFVAVKIARQKSGVNADNCSHNGSRNRRSWTNRRCEYTIHTVRERLRQNCFSFEQSLIDICATYSEMIFCHYLAMWISNRKQCNLLLSSVTIAIVVVPCEQAITASLKAFVCCLIKRAF